MAVHRPVSDPGLTPAFSFNRHGPFYRLQRWLGLLTDTDLATGRRALLFVALARVPAVRLAALLPSWSWPPTQMPFGQILQAARGLLLL
jgi:hypothetical protein